MQLTFLQAKEPLTKKYTKRADGGYDSKSYPLVSRVTSHVESVETIDEFAAALKKHADLGHCLHTGSLDQPLENESRAKHHIKEEKREWILLDLDGLTSFRDVDDFLSKLPPEFSESSYIVQESASSGLKPGLRAHVFFLLDREEDMKDIKNWVMYMNLATESLRDEITLTAKDFGLSYPLDRIANDNGRVVYIAPPECIGFEDPIKDRIRVVRKDRERLRSNFRAAVVSDVKQKEREHIDKLRADKGLPKSRAKTYYDTKGDIDVLRKDLTEPGRVFPVGKDSETIMRCNLDDGDSEAYFYYIKYPQLLRNHKGEPALYIEKIDPEFYKKALAASKEMWEEDIQPFVFRDKGNDKWYAGSRRGEEIIEQPHQIGSEAKIEAWFKQIAIGVMPPAADEIATWTQEFDPTLDSQWNPDKRVFNTFCMTDIMRNAMAMVNAPPTIERVIRHVVGGGQEEYEHMINWLAFIFQTREKTGTAWILHGVQGTGKGLLVDQILRPILGHNHVEKMLAKNLKAEFNGFLEQSLVVNLDEFDIGDIGSDAVGATEALKEWITDEFITLRKMYEGHKQVKNFSNFIITTNSPNAVPIPEGDRRFNFGRRQEEKLQITYKEVQLIKTELAHFAGFLKAFAVDRELVHTPMMNDSKIKAQHLSRNTVEEFVDAMREGDISYFVDVANQRHDDHAAAGEFKQAIKRWMADAREDQVTKIPATELLTAYKLVTGNTKTTTSKFKKTLEHKSMEAERVRMPDGSRPHGYTVEWNLSEEDKVDLGVHLKAVQPTQEDLEERLKQGLQAPGGPPKIDS